MYPREPFILREWQCVQRYEIFLWLPKVIPSSRPCWTSRRAHWDCLRRCHSSCRHNLRIWRTGGSALPRSRDLGGPPFSNPYSHCVREDLLSQNGPRRTGGLHKPSHSRVHRNLAGGEHWEARNTASTVSCIWPKASPAGGFLATYWRYQWSLSLASWNNSTLV